MSNRQYRVARRIQARDEARRARAGVAPAEWARMTRAEKTDALKRVRS